MLSAELRRDDDTGDRGLVEIRLKPIERKKLVGRSHRLKPVAVVGHAGLTEAVVAQVQHIFKSHDLIKVRIDAEDRAAVQAIAEELAAKAEATLVSKIGKIAVLYKAMEETSDRPFPSPRTDAHGRSGR